MSDLKEKLSVTLPTAQYYEDEVKCRSGCPVSTDARGYLIACEKGNHELGYAIARATNTFASICGKICGAPCEKACRRSDVDETISIRNIKGFLTNRCGPEMGDLKKALTYSTVRGSVTPELNGQSVGVIGGGVAGYTCAHDLARLGYSVTIYERHNKSGGMLIQGVPVNRLSREVVQAEIDSILQFPHVSIQHNADIGKDISFEEVRKKHGAVFIGVGLAVGKIIPMENSDHEAVQSGLKFLFDFNMAERPDLSGKKVIVIGGGDVAFDVARSALRSRSSHVELCCLERDSLGEMPGSEEERRGGRREGVVINDGWGPDKIVIENGTFKGLQIKRVKRVFDDRGNFAPEFLEETRFIPGEILYMAVGQGPDFKFLEDSGIKMTPRGMLEYDPQTMMTSLDGVFVGGDCAYGPKLFIDAIAAASDAALGIDAFLSKKALMKKKREITFNDREEYSRDSLYLDWERKERVELNLDPAREPEKNGTLEYGSDEAAIQAGRCLRCHIHPVFIGDICVLCGGCVDVCPSYCLSMKSLDRIEGETNVRSLMQKEFGDVEVASNEGSVMLFDPCKCIRCGMCAQKCPSGACIMSENSFNDCYEVA